MAFTLDVFKAIVDSLIVADDTEFSALNRYRRIRSAVERFSRDRPDWFTEDEAGDSGNYYELTGGSARLVNWVEGFSRILQIELPAPTVASDEQPVYLEPENWDDSYWAGAVRYLFLPNHAPSSSDTMRIRFTIPYQWTASSTTTVVAQVGHGFSVDDYIYLDSTWQAAGDARIATHQVSVVTDVDNFTAKILEVDPAERDFSDTDFFAVCNLVGALCCQAIAIKYSRTSDSTIAADAVAHAARAIEFSNRAKELEAAYEQHLGIGEEVSVAPAGEFVDWDTQPGWPQSRRYLYHRNR